MEINADRSAPPSPEVAGDGSTRAPSREPVIPALLALLVLGGAMAAALLWAYQTLELGAGSDLSRGVQAAGSDDDDAPGQPGETVAYIDSLDMTVDEAGGAGFTIRASGHVGSNPAVLPDVEVVVAVRLVGPDEQSFDVEAPADQRGNVAWQVDVDEPGLYTLTVIEISGEGIVYDESLDSAPLASIRAGDDDGPQVDERSVDEAEEGAEEVVDTDTGSGEIDSGIVTPPDTSAPSGGEPEEADEAEEIEEGDGSPFNDILGDVYGDGSEQPDPAPSATPFAPPVIVPEP
ncbi:MAG: hypothetical protein GEU28_01425 [Dehalococcoidia bacterium]|nr:hypothetical protein [Dehalococcoidia bacterium]